MASWGRGDTPLHIPTEMDRWNVRSRAANIPGSQLILCRKKKLPPKLQNTKKYYSYTGQWSEGLREGRGVTIHRNGDIYSGAYHEDRRHGYGDMMKDNGRRYTGDFVQGRRQGKGEMTFTNGDKYTGDWLDGKRTGKFTVQN